MCVVCAREKEERLKSLVPAILRGRPVRSVGIGTWLHGTVVDHWSLTGELSLSCIRPAAGR